MSAQATAAAPGKYGPIEVFRAGTFQDMAGNAQTIAAKDLQDIAARYDRESAPAPVVIGHPDTDTPAYGWVEHLYFERGILKATLENTVSEFADMVRAGRYKRVSISLFLPHSPNNPKPGNLYLKHVGFLGAAAPAVPGLKPVKFAGGASEAIACYQDNPAAASFAAGDELRRLRLQVREQEVETLIRDGRVLPVFKDEVIAFTASLDDNETVSFSEGSSQTRKDWFLSYLARQPKVISFGALDMGDDPFLSVAPRPMSNIPDGYTADRAHDDVYRAAREIERKDGVSFTEAVERVLEGRF